jgi:hypothetical protein
MRERAANRHRVGLTSFRIALKDYYKASRIAPNTLR